jgi:hypothetical protein
LCDHIPYVTLLAETSNTVSASNFCIYIINTYLTFIFFPRPIIRSLTFTLMCSQNSSLTNLFINGTSITFLLKSNDAIFRTGAWRNTSCRYRICSISLTLAFIIRYLAISNYIVTYTWCTLDGSTFTVRNSLWWTFTNSISCVPLKSIRYTIAMRGISSIYQKITWIIAIHTSINISLLNIGRKFITATSSIYKSKTLWALAFWWVFFIYPYCENELTTGNTFT